MEKWKMRIRILEIEKTDLIEQKKVQRDEEEKLREREERERLESKGSAFIIKRCNAFHYMYVRSGAGSNKEHQG